MAIEDRETFVNQKQFDAGNKDSKNYTDKKINKAYIDLTPRAITGTVNVTNEGWVEETGVNHPYVFYKDIEIENLNSKKRADVFVDVEYYNQCVEAGFCTVTETIDPPSGYTNGYIRIRAKTVPNTTIPINYWIIEPLEIEGE